MAKNTEQKNEQPLALDMSFDEALQRFSNVNTKDLSALANEALDTSKATPFVKWVGGKRSIIGELKSRMPKQYNNYFEGFVGGGALFFEMQPKHAFLSDLNFDLIMTYKVIQKDVEALIKLLKRHQSLHCEEYYYRLRSQHHLNEPIEIAARMIYLNKTCYNGLWRVNKKGEFNVPIGSYVKPAIVQEDNLRMCNKALQGATIEVKSYQDIQAQAGDFVYFDPPYHPTNGNNFTAYSKLDFSEKDQADLADFCKTLHRNGVKVMVSNSYTPFITDLYKSNIFKIDIINAPRAVNCKPEGRGAVEEVLITNY